MSYSTVTLTGTYQLPDGTPASGTIEIIPSERLILDDAGNVVLSGRAKAKLEERTWPRVDPDTGEPVLDADGNPVLERGGWFSVVLPATDDPRLTPTGFGYTLAAKLHHTHLPAISFSLPAATATVDVTDVTQVDPSTFAPDANYVTTAEVDAAVATQVAPLDTRVGTVEAALPGKADDAEVTALSTRVTDVEGDVAGKMDTATANEQVAGMVTGAGPTKDALSATYATVADALGIQRLDRTALARRERGAASAITKQADAAETVWDWADLTDVNPATNAQVSGNRFYAKDFTSPGGFAVGYPIQAGERAHIQTILHWKAGLGGSPIYFGVDCGTEGHALIAGEPYALSVGINSSGARNRVIGGSIPAGASATTTIGSNPTVDTDYILTVDVDDVWVTLMMKKVGTTGDAFYYGIPRATLAAAGLKPNNIFLFIQGSGTSAHSIGPMVATKSLQPARARTVAGQAVEGADHRLRTTTKAVGGDPQLYALPASYDPRTPAPVVLFCHQSLSGNARNPWSETRMQPVTEALLDAGYIVAACNAGGDLYGNAASVGYYKDLYDHLRDTYNTGPLFLFGASMGGLDILNIIGRRDWPTPAAAASVGTALTLDSVVAAGEPYLTTFRNAYGIAADMSDYETKTAGYRPESRAGWEYRGVPFRLYTSTGDPTQPPAGSEAFEDKVDPYGPADVVYGSGGHLDASQYQASDVVSFFNTYR